MRALGSENWIEGGFDTFALHGDFGLIMPDEIEDCVADKCKVQSRKVLPAGAMILIEIDSNSQ